MRFVQAIELVNALEQEKAIGQSGQIAHRLAHTDLVILDELGNGTVQKDGKVPTLEIKKGDKIPFGKYSGQTVKVEGAEYL